MDKVEAKIKRNQIMNPTGQSFSRKKRLQIKKDAIWKLYLRKFRRFLKDYVIIKLDEYGNKKRKNPTID